MQRKSELMEEAVAAGWLKSHIKDLPATQIRQLLRSGTTGYSFDAIVDRANRSTLVKTATKIYKLNPILSRKMSLVQLRDFIKTESLYAGEGLTGGPSQQGPFYPGFRATSEINRPEMVLTESSLYTPQNLTPSEAEAVSKIDLK